MAAIVPWKVQDTVAGRDVISKDAARTLKLEPISYIVRHNSDWSKETVYQITINSMNEISSKKIEVREVDLPDFAIVERLRIKELKERFTHVQATNTLFI